jgi:hypothetical protein
MNAAGQPIEAVMTMAQMIKARIFGPPLKPLGAKP